MDKNTLWAALLNCVAASLMAKTVLLRRLVVPCAMPVKSPAGLCAIQIATFKVLPKGHASNIENICQPEKRSWQELIRNL